jgi:hypothetical protein
MSKWKDVTRVLGLGALACAACCAGPILALLGGITILGIASSYFIGVAGLAIAAAAAIGWFVLRRRRKDSCNVRQQPVSIRSRRDDSEPDAPDERVDVK